MVQTFTISRDPQYYHAFPDVVLTASGRKRGRDGCDAG